jgi:osmotically-inducible protein OsmY
MKKYLTVFIVGLLMGTAGYWTFRDGPLANKVRESSIVQKVSDTIDDRATGRLKEEMEKQGKIVMNKPAGLSLPKVEDGRLSDLVKAKIAAEPTLSDTSIKVEVKDGEVSLQGTATSYEQVARAMRLGLDCDATRTVVSTIQVKAK